MKIFSKKIKDERLAADVYASHVAQELGKSVAWFSRVERGLLSISPATEQQIISLIRSIGALQRDAAIAKRKLAAEIFVPDHAPHNVSVR